MPDFFCFNEESSFTFVEIFFSQRRNNSNFMTKFSIFILKLCMVYISAVLCTDDYSGSIQVHPPKLVKWDIIGKKTWLIQNCYKWKIIRSFWGLLLWLLACKDYNNFRILKIKSRKQHQFNEKNDSKISKYAFLYESIGEPHILNISTKFI